VTKQRKKAKMWSSCYMRRMCDMMVGNETKRQMDDERR